MFYLSTQQIIFLFCSGVLSTAALLLIVFHKQIAKVIK